MGDPREKLGLLPGLYEVRAAVSRQIDEIEAAFRIGQSATLSIPGITAEPESSVVRHSFAGPPKRKMSAAARKRIGEATKRRWALKRAAATKKK